MEQAKINFRLMVLDIAWFGLGLPAVARFLAVYLIRLDASPTLLGWQAALPAIVALVTSSLAVCSERTFTPTFRSAARAASQRSTGIR
jgi:hypothetical protein